MLQLVHDRFRRGRQNRDGLGDNGVRQVLLVRCDYSVYFLSVCSFLYVFIVYQKW